MDGQSKQEYHSGDVHVVSYGSAVATGPGEHVKVVTRTQRPIYDHVNITGDIYVGCTYPASGSSSSPSGLPKVDFTDPNISVDLPLFMGPRHSSTSSSSVGATVGSSMGATIGSRTTPGPVCPDPSTVVCTKSGNTLNIISGNGLLTHEQLEDVTVINAIMSTLHIPQRYKSQITTFNSVGGSIVWC